MTRNKRLSLFITFLLFIPSILIAQDPILEHGMGNAVLNNPAMTGAFQRPTLQSGFRNQWLGSYITGYSSYDSHIDALHGGLGLDYMIDAAGEGTLITQQLGISYAYRAELTEKASLRIGLHVAGFKRSLDWSKLSFGDQIDSRYGFIYETQQEIGLSRIYGLNFKFGAALVHRNYMISYAAHNLNQANHSMLPGVTSRWPLRHFVQAAYCIEFNDKSGIIYDAIAQRQSQFNYLLLKANYYHKFLRIGTGINLNKRLLGMVGAQLRNFRLSYIYSRDESILTQSTLSSHEVQFTWSLQTIKGRARECPLVIWNGF